MHNVIEALNANLITKEEAKTYAHRLLDAEVEQMSYYTRTIMPTATEQNAKE